MAIETPCQTSGAVFSTRITPRGISVDVDFGRTINLDQPQAELLEANVHNVLELALSRYFPEVKT
jgi:hypothetical protein